MNRISNIVLIGCGEIGSRHLQSIVELDYNYKLIIIEPSEHSQAIAKERLCQSKRTNPNAQDPIFFQNIDELPDVIDFLIIATNSDARPIIIEQVFSKHTVRYCLLEKILAQSINELERIYEIIQKNGTRAWVNCPQRYWPFFEYIREFIYKKDFTILVHGTDWNISSNAIHNIDLLAYYSDQNNDLDTFTTDHIKTIESKRIGFSEFYGTVFTTTSNNLLIQTSEQSGNHPLSFTIVSDDFYASYDLISEDAYISCVENDNQLDVMKFKVLYQSSLTSEIILEIFKKDECNLPTIKESIYQHYSLFQGLSSIFSDYNNDMHIKKLPIT